MRPSRLWGQFGWVSAGRIVAALVQAGSMLLLARLISPGLFGWFAAAQGVLLIAQAASSLGLGTFIVRERARNPSGPSVYSALRLNEVTSLIFATTLAAFIAAIAPFEPRLWPFIPLALAAACERSADVWLNVAVADGDARVNTVNLIARRFTAAATFLLLITVVPIDPILAFGSGSLIAAALSWMFARRFIMRRNVFDSSPTSARAILRESRPYWANSIATQVRNLDTTIVLAVTTSAQAGFYGLAARLTTPLRLLPTSLAAVVLPMAARTRRDSLSSLVRVVLVSCICLSIFYIGVFIAIPWAIPAALGAAYSPAIPAVQVTTLGLIAAGCASILNAVLQGVGLGVFASRAAFVMTITCLGGVAAGGAAYGALGASVGLATSYVVQASMLALRLTMYARRREDDCE
ncbi:oligosaccharide flippase family protein [Microbacterium sp. 179-I 1D1 NHS]|uniref:oligosaccharide flippase family protein n=1 Tax=unclassified Microbacterium TaxID=2609290 RepID=UPI00387939C6